MSDSAAEMYWCHLLALAGLGAGWVPFGQIFSKSVQYGHLGLHLTF